MTVYVSDLFTATPAPVNATPTSTRTWQWLRGSSAISGATSASYTAVTADIGSTLSATQLETNFLATTTATSAATEVVQAFDPIRLFSASEPGVWYDPSDMSTLYQNAAGTIPVTSFGQPVGLMLDKSRGLVLGPELVVNGDFSSATGWTLGSGWTISGGVATQAGLGSLTQINVFTSGISYEVSMDVVSVSAAGDLGFQVNGVNQTGFTVSAPTTIRQIIFAGASGSFGLVHRGAATWRGSIDNISVKELPGLHATQSTDPSRPMYGIVPVSGRRNLLTQSEAFNEAVWVKSNFGLVIADALTAPDGTLTADKLVLTSGQTNAPQISQNFSAVSGQNYALQVVAKAAEESHAVLISGGAGSGAGVRVDLATGTVVQQFSALNLVSYDVTSLGNGWWRIAIVATANATGTGTLLARATSTSGTTYLGTGTNGIYIWGAQLETGSTATAYQRVSTDLDVTEAGVASVGYLRFDGSTSWMVTPTITPGTDKVQVFAGVRKNSDAALAMLVEIDGVAATQTFFVAAPRNAATGDYAFRSAGSAASQAQTSASYVAPITNTLTALGDISGDLATLRVNGVQAAQNTADQGTGNYNPAPLYIGRRSGTSLPFNGHLFPLIVRFGPNLTAARIAATEAWVATKTAGVVLP